MPKWFWALIFIVLTAVFVVDSISKANAAPNGFCDYRIKRGDTLRKIASEKWAQKLVLKVNRVDARHLRAGKKILVPCGDSIAAMTYMPVPDTTSHKGRRVVVFYRASQYFGAYENGKLVHWGPISSGKGRRGTPRGVFRAKWKDRWHRSRRYNNAKMWFAVQFNGHIFFHQQVLPGYPASHGCVRLLAEDAELSIQMDPPWRQGGSRLKGYALGDGWARAFSSRPLSLYLYRRVGQLNYSRILKNTRIYLYTLVYILGVGNYIAHFCTRCIIGLCP